MMHVMIASVYVGDYLVLTFTPDGSWYTTFNYTNVTKGQCSECHPGSFADQSMCILYCDLLGHCLNTFVSLSTSL